MKSILKKKITHLGETQKIAHQFYDEFLTEQQNVTLFFEGGLGVGKTFFIRELIKKSGFDDKIASPTYTYIQEYDTPHHHFAHFDFYRLHDPQEFFARGFDEIVQMEGIKCVEWPEKINDSIKKGFSGTHYTLQLSHGIGVGMREIQILI